MTDETDEREQIIGKDLALYHWHFFFRWRGENPDENEQQFWHRFTAPFLDEAVNAFGGWEKSTVPKPLVSPEKPDLTVRLANISWREEGDTARALEARTLLDSFYLRTALEMMGANTLAHVAALRAKAWQPKKIDSKALLGEAFCFWLELAPPKPALPADADRLSDEQQQHEHAERLAAELLRVRAGAGQKQVRVEAVRLDFGYLVWPEDSGEAVCVVLVRDENAARSRASYFVYHLRPSIWLARLKLSHLERAFLPHGKAMRPLQKGLQDEVDEMLRQARFDLNTTENASEQISLLQMRLAGHVGAGQNCLATLRTNIENVERVLQDAMFQEQREQLAQLLLAPLQVTAAQFESDLGYAHIQRDRAAGVLQGMGVLTQVRAAKWERWITIMFGLLALFGIPQMFPELTDPNKPQFIPFKWRIISVIVLSFSVYLVTRLLSKAKARPHKQAGAKQQQHIATKQTEQLNSPNANTQPAIVATTKEKSKQDDTRRILTSHPRTDVGAIRRRGSDDVGPQP